jgi:hypothetical protein
MVPGVKNSNPFGTEMIVSLMFESRFTGGRQGNPNLKTKRRDMAEILLNGVKPSIN